MHGRKSRASKNLSHKGAMVMNTTLILILALLTKHFVVDFLMQTEYQWSNKGNYGHFGGVLHSMLHGFGTIICFAWYAPMAAAFLATIDYFAHYHIDWAKVNINKHFGWGPTTHAEYWYMVGLDQFLHALTYVFLIWLVTA